FCQPLLGATTLWALSDLERRDNLLPANLLICSLDLRARLQFIGLRLGLWHRQLHAAGERDLIALDVFHAALDLGAFRPPHRFLGHRTGLRRLSLSAQHRDAHAR